MYRQSRDRTAWLPWIMRSLPLRIAPFYRTELAVAEVTHGRHASGKLPSRRQHKTDPDKSALQEIMSEVDELSRDRG